MQLKESPPLFRFVSISIAVHAAILTWTATGRPPPDVSPPPVLKVLLTSAPEPVTPPAAPRMTEAPARSLPRPSAPPVLASPQSTSPAPSVITPPSPATPISEVPSTRIVEAAPPPTADIEPPRPRVDESAVANYSKIISGAVSAHKRYPQIARIRGWQGTAWIEARIGSSGNLVASRITKTSGYEVLDRQALDMLSRAAPFPAFQGKAPEGTLLVQLPVQFTLVE